MIDLDARQALDQLEDRAVVMRVAARGGELAGDRRDGGFGRNRLAESVGLVGDAAHQSDVERQHGALAEHDHGRARPHRVADAELVEHVGVGAGDVGDGVMAEHQPLEHRLVNGAADLLLVGADRLEPGLGDRRRDDPLVHRVEIGHAACGVELLAERHQHEAERSERFSLLHEQLLSGY